MLGATRPPCSPSSLLWWWVRSVLVSFVKFWVKRYYCYCICIYMHIAAFWIYTYAVVYSFYKEMKEEEAQLVCAKQYVVLISCYCCCSADVILVDCGNISILKQPLFVSFLAFNCLYFPAHYSATATSSNNHLSTASSTAKSILPRLFGTRWFSSSIGAEDGSVWTGSPAAVLRKGVKFTYEYIKIYHLV